ncbi:MAG: hypothetical protein WCK49_08905 [Myxococcaceae bacterium]
MKNSQLQIRISDIQKHALQQAASSENMDLSAWVLSKLFLNPRTLFLKKIESLASNRKYGFADLADFLKNLNSTDLQEILQVPWSVQLEPLLANYVAAMLELCAHRHKIRAPYWLSQIEPLEDPCFGTDLKSLRLYLLTVSPVPFRARNIFIDTTLEGRV